MKLNCKPGDLAIVTWDEPGCVMNVGRLVRVHGPLDTDPAHGPTWLIVPVRRTRWQYVCQTDGTVQRTTVRLKDGIEHPDRWLIPIRPDHDRIDTDELSTACDAKGMVHPVVMASMQQRIDASLVRFLLGGEAALDQPAPGRTA